MKKKLLVLVMSGVMAAFALTACGSKDAATTNAETTAEAVTEAETTVAETTEAETTEAETTEAADAAAADAAVEDAAIVKYDEYLGWTDKEWSAATEAEKLDVAIVYSVYVTEALGGEEFDEETKALVVAEMRNNDAVNNVISQLDATLPQMKMSIKEFADFGVEETNKLLETAEAAE